jgi:hypothetical protein
MTTASTTCVASSTAAAVLSKTGRRKAHQSDRSDTCK